MSIGSIQPIAAYTPQAITPAQSKVTQSSTDSNNNHVTLNAINMADIRGIQVENIALLNEIDMNISGSNNDITVNAINILVEGAPNEADSNSAIIHPVQNPDGTISFAGGDVNSFVDSKLLEAIDAAAKAYNKTHKGEQSVVNPLVDMTV